jgi:tetratricopeptide (TPR) repeat protein
MKKRVFTVMAALVGATALLVAQAPKEVATAGAPQPKSAKENDAIKKIVNAKTPDEKIAAVENLITNFADTSFKSVALYLAAEAADQNKDYIHAVSYGELSIEADPKGGDAMNAMLLVAGELAQHTGKNDLDKEMKLTKAEKYVAQALEMIPNVPKPAGSKVSDADFAAFKKDKVSEAHRDLGLIAAARQKWPLAATEFKIAVDGAVTQDSVMMARLGNAYNESGQFADAKTILQKVVAIPDVNPQVKAFAASELTRADRGLKAANK